MKDVQRRYLFFLLGCIPTRLLFTLLAYKIKKEYLPYLAVITLIIGLGFLRIYFFVPMKEEKVGAFGGKIWWNELRLVHGFLYILFSVYAFQKKKFSWKVLLIDTIIGLFAFLIHYNFI